MSIKRFTVTQILYYIESCAKAIADGDVVNIIYFGFAKAFNTLLPFRDKCHFLTLGKLQNIKHNNHLGDTELEHVLI